MAKKAMRAEKVRLTRDGYAPGGKYFDAGAPVYRVEFDDGREGYVRASSAKEAKRLAKEDPRRWGIRGVRAPSSPRPRRGMRGTAEEHLAMAERNIELAESWLDRARDQTGKARTESAIQATTASSEAMANCLWTAKVKQTFCYNQAANIQEKAMNILRKKR